MFRSVERMRLALLCLFLSSAVWAAPVDPAPLLQRIAESDDPFVILGVERGADEASATAAYQSIFKALQRIASSDSRAREALGKAQKAFAAIRTEDPYKTFGTSAETLTGKVSSDLLAIQTRGVAPAEMEIDQVVSLVELAGKPHEVLGVQEKASEAEARRAFQKLFRVLQKSSDSRAVAALARAKSAYMAMRSSNPAKSFESLAATEAARAEWRTTPIGRAAALKPEERARIWEIPDENALVAFLINATKSTPGSLSFELTSIIREVVSVNNSRGAKLDLNRAVKRVLSEYVFIERVNPFEQGYLRTGAHIVFLAASDPSYKSARILYSIKANARVLGLADSRFKSLAELADQAIAMVLASSPRAKWASLFKPAAYCNAILRRIFVGLSAPGLSY